MKTMFNLYRVIDGLGFTGTNNYTSKPEGGIIETGDLARPRIGQRICVGNERDAFITDMIVEIVSEEPNICVFKTTTDNIFIWERYFAKV
jgi:hypothetical protein